MTLKNSDCRLFRVVIPVHGLDEAEKFYKVVLGVEGQRVSPGRHYFLCDGVILCIYDPIADGDSDPVHSYDVPLYFETTELEATFARMESSGKCKELGAISVRPWGERSFYIVDPFGNRLCFVDSATTFSGQFYVD